MRRLLLIALGACGATGNATDGRPQEIRPDGPPCVLFPNGGCGALACDLDPVDYVHGGKRCRPTGDGRDETECSGNDCAAGYTCRQAGNGFACLAFCSGDDDCPGARCALSVTFDDGTDPMRPVAGGTVCSTACDPFTAQGCPPGWACRVARDLDPYTFCETAGAGDDRTPCDVEADCRAGYACAAADRGTACYRFCEVGGGSECPVGMACTAFGEHPTFNGTEVGVCHE